MGATVRRLSAMNLHPDPHGSVPTGAVAVLHDPAGSDAVEPLDAMEVDSDSVQSVDHGIPVVVDAVGATYRLSSAARYRVFA